MNKRLSLLALFLALLLLLPACGEEPDLLLPPDETQDEPAQQPDEPPSDTEEEPAADPEPDAPAIPMGTADRVIDTSFLAERDQAVDYVWPATDDLLFVFTSDLRDGLVTERSSLYVYSISEQAFTSDWTPIGIIGQYPQEHYDDGSVMVLTRNSEHYGYETMLFIDPYTLSIESRSLSGLTDLRNLHISPDKAYAALSTQQGLQITDLSFETVYAEYSGFVPEGGDPDLDYHLPIAVGWLPDSSAVAGKLLGWEWIYHPFLLAADGTLTELKEQAYLAAAPYGKDLLFYDPFTLEPTGLLADGEVMPLNLDGLPDDSGMAYISALACASDGRWMALSVASPQEDPVCRTDFYLDGAARGSLSIPASGTYPSSVDLIDFVPGGEYAVLMTGATVDQPRQIHLITLEQLS